MLLMSWCSEWIRDWLRNGPRTQLELARLGGVDAGSVSRWLSGQSRPDGDILVRFAGRLPDSEMTGLVAAWVKDQLPETLRRYVVIQSSDTANQVAVEPVAQISGFSDDLRERLEFFGLLSIDNPAIRKIIDVVYEAAVAAREEPVGRKKGRK